MARPFQLRDRWRLAIVSISVVVLLAASVTAALYNERQYRAEATASATVEAHVLADTVTAALSFGDRSALSQYVNALKANPEVDAVGVFDERGQLVASFTRSSIATRFDKTLNRANAPGRIIATAPVAEDGTHLGDVYVRFISEPLARRVSRYIGPGVLVLMAAIMVLLTTLDARALAATNRDLIAQIAERERVEAALRQSQKMEAIGRLTGGIAHDFNNMLAVILGSLDLLVRRFPEADPRLIRLADAAREGANRAAALTQLLLAFSRLTPLKPGSVDVGRAMTDVAELLRRTLGESIVVEVVNAGGLWGAQIDLAQLETAIVNLAINARDAMPDGGKLTIESANTYHDRAYTAEEPDVVPGQYVMVAITDTGSGMPPQVLSQVFEPFFTTKPAGLGTGLGLSQVHGFIKQSGGHVRIYSEVGVGTTVKLYLPRSLVEPERPVKLTKAASHGKARARRDVTVLLAEDEAGVRAFATEALTELGYDVLPAADADEALRTLDDHPEVGLLLTDVIMPDVNGRGLANEVLRRRPDLKVVFMTGYTQNAIVHNGMLDPGTRLVTKPFTVTQLESELEAALSETA